jgi:flagellar basal body-associated protein FliL
MKLPIPHGRRAILILGVPLGLAAAGGFLFMSMSAKSGPPPAIPDPSPGQHGPMLALDSRVINLTTSTTPGLYKYAKIAVTIELRPTSAGFYAMSSDARAKEEKAETDKVSDDVPLLLDALGTVVSGHDSASINSPDGHAQLKTELLAAMRKVLGDSEVLNVYFTDLVMQ